MIPINSIVCATGHRPDKLGGYSDANTAFLSNIAEKWLRQNSPSKVISGMALGWDTAVALAALRSGIRLIAAVPFKSQPNVWPKASQDLYREILSKASAVHIICEGFYSPTFMQIRNEWMVDHSDVVLAMYNGDPKSGTANCVKYAMSKDKSIENLWGEYERCRAKQ